MAKRLYILEPESYENSGLQILRRMKEAKKRKWRSEEAKHPEPGTITAVAKDRFSVQTGEGLLTVLELQIPGKKRMDAGAFLRGYQIKAGEILG